MRNRKQGVLCWTGKGSVALHSLKTLKNSLAAVARGSCATTNLDLLRFSNVVPSKNACVTRFLSAEVNN